MEAGGHPAVARIHSFGADGDGTAAYFDTVDSLGFFVEAVEPLVDHEFRASLAEQLW